MKPKLVVLTGAGISAESGLQTFRNSPEGLWETFKIEDVCTVKAWNNDPTKVNGFYNMRRQEALSALPNKAHIAISEAEEMLDVTVITTNVDILHEQAGSSNVLHLHGRIDKARSSRQSVSLLEDYLLETHLVPVSKEGIKPFQEHPDGSLLRPHVVFFGEAVPNMEKAIEVLKEADYLIIVGTSLSVYPAASLMYDAVKVSEIFYVDPEAFSSEEPLCTGIKKPATVGVPEVLELIKEKVAEKVTS